MRFSQWMYSFFDLCLLVKFYLIQTSVVADDDLSFNQNMFSKLKRGFRLLIMSIFLLLSQPSGNMYVQKIRKGEQYVCQALYLY